MEFDKSLISSLPRSLNFLIRSCDLACNTLMKGKLFSDKPDYVVQQEQFSEFFENVLKKPEAIEKFRNKVLKDVYDSNYTDVIEKIINDGKANDKFMLSGIEFRFGKFVLPISKIYRNATLHGRSVHPPKILLGFYAVMYYTVKEEESKECLDLVSSNINSMIETIEEMARPPPGAGGGMSGGNFFKDALSKFDLGQTTEMLNKISSDPKMSGEFKKMCGKVQEVFESGNPMESLGDLIKESSIHAAEAEGSSLPAEEVVRRMVSSEHEEVPPPSSEGSDNLAADQN